MTFVKPDASTKITLCYMLILFQTISGTWYFKTIYMLKVYSVYEQNIKSESRKANYNANQCIVMDIVENFMYKKRNKVGNRITFTSKG